MDAKRTPAEELAFKAAELDTAMKEAGFILALADPEAGRDFAYRARYLRPPDAPVPRLHASLEYYLATRAFSLKISAEAEQRNPVYDHLVKNHRGSLRELLEAYFASIRKCPRE